MQLFAPLKSIENTKVYDVLAASPLVGLYGWILVRDWPVLAAYYNALARKGFDISLFTEALGFCLSLSVAALLIVLVFIRIVPIKKSVGLGPRIVALFGTGGGLAILTLPPAALPLWLDMVSVSIVLCGLCAMLVSLAWLRRSFSVLPEARRLVTSGPYALVRHPVYAFEELTLFGVMLQFLQPWALALFFGQLCFQFARIPFEERVLADAFPEYAEYASRTARFIPGIY